MDSVIRSSAETLNLRKYLGTEYAENNESTHFLFHYPLIPQSAFLKLIKSKVKCKFP